LLELYLFHKCLRVLFISTDIFIFKGIVCIGDDTGTILMYDLNGILKQQISQDILLQPSQVSVTVNFTS